MLSNSHDAPAAQARVQRLILVCFVSQSLRRALPCVLRYYLKNNLSTEPLVPDELMSELKKEAQISLTQLNPFELALQLTLEDFKVFKEIQATEYIDEIFKLRSKFGAPNLNKFSDVSISCCLFYISMWTKSYNICMYVHSCNHISTLYCLTYIYLNT